MAALGQLNIKIGATISGLQNGLRKAEKSLGKSSKRMARMSSNMARSISAPLALLAGASLKAAADNETLETSFKTLTGSAEEAKSIMEDLIGFAAATPFSLDSLAKSQKTLMGFGMSVKEARFNLELLGNASGGSSEKLQGLAVVMGQVKGAGRLMGQDINQFINQGVPVLQLLGDVLGKTAGEIKEMGSEGKLSFELLESAFVAANEEGGMFYKGMEEQSKTLNGLMSTLRDNGVGALREFGNTLVETFDIKGLLSKFTKKIQSITTAFKKLPDSQKAVIVKMAALAAAIPLVLMGIAALGTALSFIGGVLATAMAAFGTAVSVISGGIATLFSPVYLIAGAIIGLAAAFIYAYNHSETFRKTVNAIGAMFKTWITETIGQIKMFVGVFKKLFSGDFDGAFDLANDLIKKSFNKIGKSVKAGLDRFKEAPGEPLSVDAILKSLGIDRSAWGTAMDEAENMTEADKLIDKIKSNREKLREAVDPKERKSIGSELLGQLVALRRQLKAEGKSLDKEMQSLLDKLAKEFSLSPGDLDKLETGDEPETQVRDVKYVFRIDDNNLTTVENDLQAHAEKMKIRLRVEGQERAIKKQLEFNDALAAMNNLMNNTEGLFSDLFGGISQGFVSLMSSFATDGMKGFTGISWSSLWDGLKEGTQAAWASVSQIVNGAMSSISQIATRSTEKQLAEIDARYAKEEEGLENLGLSREAHDTHLKGLNKKRQKEEAAARMKSFRAEKAASMASATMALASAVLSALKLGPIYAAAVGALGAVQLGTIASQKPPQFAKGGIVSGRTLAEVGEYAGVKSNPEVIAPLDKLRSILGDTQGSGHITGEFRLRGDDLVAAVGKANSRSQKFSGKTQF